MKHIGRKLYHLLGGLGLLSLYYLLGRQQALICYGGLIAVVLAVDITRLRVPAFNQFIQTRFSSFIRKNEANKLTGTAPYVLGIALTLLLYRTDIATAAICFLAFGDVAATTVGERYGRTKISGEKSLEGTMAFVAAAVLSGVLLNFAGIHLMHGLILAGAIVAAGVELLPLPVNDNLVIPVVSGGVMELIARTTGCA
ncbi:MAG: diacylglycerol/polyprenol kinase family protein [Nitrospirota bacterium]